MRRVSKSGIAAAAIIGVAQFARFTATNPPVHSDLVAPADVKGILRRACYDCPSNQTEWPWYSGIAPASWVVHHEVTEGRRRLNFSDWGEYESDPDTAVQKLDEIAKFVASGDMAPWYYRLFQADARLSTSQRELIIRWSEQDTGKQHSHTDLGPAAGVISMARSRWSLQTAKSDRQPG